MSIIVEIYSNSKVYYKSVTLDIALLEEIVINRIDIKAIAQFAEKHSEYSFVLISDYNFLPKFREALNSSNIFVPKNHLAEFPQIWQEKQRLNFPLFGQYLDKIKFQIQRDGETQWIEVLSTEEQDHIYYEGDPQTKRFIARIQETGQEYFDLSHRDTILPIQINDQDYCINGITQEYKILHPLPKLEKLRVRIEFVIKLGFVPRLKVIDQENNYQIEAQLQDYIEIKPSLNCIPLKSILKHREQQFKNKIPNPILCKTITASISSVKKIDSLRQLPLISDHIKAANETIRSFKRKNSEPFLYVNGNLESLKDLKYIINRFYNCGVIEAITNYVNNNDRSIILATERQNINNAVKNVLNFIGRTHKLSDSYISSLFFNQQFIDKATKQIGIEYYTFLAKVAFHENFQIAYFSIFNSDLNNNKPCYQLEEYLWGYSRILLWYSEYYRQYQNNELDYLNHFQAIANYLLNSKIKAGSNKSKRYQQDAFLALIYLLTFREADLSFCTTDSEEYQLAERVIEKYKISLVRLKAVHNQSLNECFEELLNGNSSQESVRRIIEAD